MALDRVKKMNESSTIDTSPDDSLVNFVRRNLILSPVDVISILEKQGWGYGLKLPGTGF